MQRNIIDFSSFYDPDKQSLDLSSQEVTDLDIADYILPFLHANPVTTLNLSHNRITAGGLAGLTLYLKMYPYPLQALDMSHNPLHAISKLHEKTELEGKVLSPPSLISLNLSDTNIQSSSLEALKAFPFLQEIDVSNNNLKDISKLKEYVGPSLIKLNVSGTNIKPSSLGVLKDFPFLQELDISHNGLEKISPLKGASSLTKLNMSHNKLGLSSRWFALSGIPFLTELDISHNEINERESVFIPLKRLRYLTKLNISHNNIEDQAVKSFLVCVGGCEIGRGVHIDNVLSHYHAKKPFTDINVSQCGLKDEGILALANLPHLVTFDFSQNKMTLAGAKAFLELPNMDPLKKVNYIKQHADIFSLTEKEKKELAKACDKASSLQNIVLFNLSKSIPGLIGCSLLVKEYDLTSHLESADMREASEAGMERIIFKEQEKDKEKAKRNCVPLLYRVKKSTITKYFLYGDPVGDDKNWQVMEIEAENANIDQLFNTEYLFLSSIKGFVEIKPNSPVLTMPFLKENVQAENVQAEIKLTIGQVLSKGHHYLKSQNEKLNYLAEHGYQPREMLNIELENKIKHQYDPETRSLNLANLNLTDEDFIDFVLPFLKEHLDIASLDLSGNEMLGAESIQSLSDCLHDKNLTTLCLNGINFPDSGMDLRTDLRDSLKDIGRIKSLTTLEISNNRLPSESIAEFLPYLPRLQSIDISNNLLGSADLIAINQRKSLRKIKMSHCSIGVHLGSYFTTGFAEIMPNLAELDISHNEIMFLPSHFAKYPALESLILNDNPEIDIKPLVIDGLLKNKKLTRINLSNCNLNSPSTSNGLGSLIEKLVNAPHLIDLDITGNKITFSQACKYMQVNPANKQKYLEQIMEEQKFSYYRKTLLKIHYAVEMNHFEEVKSLMPPDDQSLLGSKYSFNYDLWGALLLRAIVKSHETIALYLLEQFFKLDIDKDCFYKKYANQEKILQDQIMRFDKYANQIQQDAIMASFRFFFKHNEVTAVRLLTSKGADINQPVNPANPNSLSFIYQATMDGNYEMIMAMCSTKLMKLLKLRDSDGLNPLFRMAAEQKHADVTRYFLVAVLRLRDDDDIRNGLREAAIKGNVESFKKLIESFKTTAKKHFDFASALDIKTRKTVRDSLFESLLEEVLYNKIDDKSSLRRAVENDQVEMVDYLLSQGVTDDTATCLKIALKKSNFPIAVSLIENEKILEKYLFDTSSDEISCFRWAFNNDRRKAVSMLIQTYNIDVMQKADETKTNSPSFIHQAIMDGNIEMVKAIISAAPRVLEYKDNRGYTPLMAAVGAKKKNNDLILCLLEVSLEHDIQRQKIDFNKAVINGELQEVKKIVETISNKYNFFSPELQKKCNELIKRYLSHLLDSGIEQCAQLTPLMLAVKYGHTEIMNYLLEQGANPNVRVVHGFNKGESAFNIAYDKMDTSFNNYTQNYAQIIIALIKKGFDVTQIMHPSAVSPLSFIHDAVIKDDLEMVKLMVEGTRQAEKNILSLLSFKDERGCTPLMLATREMKIPKQINYLLKYLLAEGVNVNDCDNEGRTALYYALQSSSLRSAVVLIKNGADLSAISLEKRMLVYNYLYLDGDEYELARQMEENDKELAERLLQDRLDSLERYNRLFAPGKPTEKSISLKVECPFEEIVNQKNEDQEMINRTPTNQTSSPEISELKTKEFHAAEETDKNEINIDVDKDDNVAPPSDEINWDWDAFFESIRCVEANAEIAANVPDETITDVPNEITEMAKSIFEDEKNQTFFISMVKAILQDKTQTLPLAYDNAYADVAKFLIYEVARRFVAANQETFMIFANTLSSSYLGSSKGKGTFEEAVLRRAADQVLLFNQLEQMLDEEKKAIPSAFRSQFMDIVKYNILNIADWDKNEGTWKNEIKKVSILILEKVSLVRFLRNEHIRIQVDLGKFMNDNVKTQNKLNVITRFINQLESGVEEAGSIKTVAELKTLKTKLINNTDFTQSRNRFFTIESDTKKHFENRYGTELKNKK